MNIKTVVKEKKSMPFTKEEIKRIKKIKDSQKTTIDAALMLGVDRLVLDRLLLTGSAAERTVLKIRKNLKSIPK